MQQHARIKALAWEGQCKDTHHAQLRSSTWQTVRDILWTLAVAAAAFGLAWGGVK